MRIWRRHRAWYFSAKNAFSNPLAVQIVAIRELSFARYNATSKNVINVFREGCYRLGTVFVQKFYRFVIDRRNLFANDPYIPRRGRIWLALFCLEHLHYWVEPWLCRGFTEQNHVSHTKLKCKQFGTLKLLDVFHQAYDILKSSILVSSSMFTFKKSILGSHEETNQNLLYSKVESAFPSCWMMNHLSESFCSDAFENIPNLLMLDSVGNVMEP